MSQSQPFLCIFAVPKPFDGMAAIHQRNAVESWRRLGGDVEVVLCGDDPGVAEAAQEFGARHVSAIDRTDLGTPLVSAAFAAATARSNAKLLCYVNADIILMSDFLHALKRLPLERFLLCGRRWDLDVDRPLDFASRHWEEDLRSASQRDGKLHAPEAMDYFAFPRGLIQNMPGFAVGRAMWDNWLVFHARALGAPVVDSTPQAIVVHQNHDYGHMPGGVNGVWRGPEARANRILAQEMLYPFTIADATLVFEHGRLGRRTGLQSLIRSAESTIALAVRQKPALRKFIRTILRAKDA